MTVYILGSGAMGSAMAYGLRNSGFEVVVVGRTATSISNLKKDGFKCEIYGESYDISGKTLILAFKPYALEDAAKRLSGKATLCISVLARTTVDTLKKHVRAGAYAVCMPNLAARWNASITPFIGGDAASEILNGFGECVKCDSESEFAAAGVIAGCAPAYLALVAGALASGAVAEGLNANAAHKAVKGVFESTAKMLANSHPALLIDAVCSPAGTTIEGVAQLESAGVRGAFMAAVKASAGKQKS